MGSEFWVPRKQVSSGLAFGWVHTGPSLAVLAFDQTELLFSVPRTAAASLWALDSTRVGQGLRIIPGDPLGSAVRGRLPLPCLWWDRWDGSWNLLVPKDHGIVASNLVQFSREKGYVKLLPRSTGFRYWTGVKPVEEFYLRLQDLPPHPET